MNTPEALQELINNNPGCEEIIRLAFQAGADHQYNRPFIENTIDPECVREEVRWMNDDGVFGEITEEQAESLEKFTIEEWENALEDTNTDSVLNNEELFDALHEERTRICQEIIKRIARNRGFQVVLEEEEAQQEHTTA